ncbi:MAG: hypothetical protein OEZ02_12210, partial [Anaerolineae bacterium]|nr:hypothetical protein [Anaerolineae bacterium]
GLGRAHALEEFSTLEVPHVHVADKPRMYTPDDLGGVPIQVLALPWIARSGMMAYLDIQVSDPAEIYTQLEEKISGLVEGWLEDVDPDIPVVLTAHASVQGASFGGERTVMLGGDLVLSGSLVKDKRLDYVALGHIHKPQDLNDGGHPPVIYPGSIERVDFGEAKDEKFYIIVDVAKGKSTVVWHELKGIRKFIDRYKKIDSDKDVTGQLRKTLPAGEAMQDAIVRLVLEYPREWEPLIDEAALRELTAGTFEFHLVKRPQMETRILIPEDQAVGSLTPKELLQIFWKSMHTEEDERKTLLDLAQEIIEGLNDQD